MVESIERHKFLSENLQRYRTLAELRGSAFFAECRSDIEILLTIPEVRHHPATVPRLRSFLRVAQWNIEKGRKFAQILDALKLDPTLKFADAILLNEVDHGMIRSGNRQIGRELADGLGMHMAFGAAHLELTKGTGEDLQTPGENRESLQGNAILSRYPILEARVVPLPVCFEPYHFHERRYGRRNCVWARVQIGQETWWLGSVHLEVRDTPRCRARQMRYLLSHLPGSPAAHHLLGGDLNSNGFGRGTRLRTFSSVWQLTMRPAAKVQEELLHPERGAEPLFRVAQSAGFHWSDFNSGEETAWAALDELEDANLLPGIIRQLIEKRLDAYGQYLRFKLDWILARGVRALKDRELRDVRTGVVSLDPGSVRLQLEGLDRLSDHRPIYADLRIAE